MIHTLVVTLGKLGEALIASSDHIIGRSSRISSLSLSWSDDLDTWKHQLDERIRSTREMGEILLLTDMFGSSSTNIAIEHSADGGIEILTGVNLPMLIKAATLPNNITLAEAAGQVRAQGQKSIYIASEML
jgi:PTS system mannose-specific IIA component